MGGADEGYAFEEFFCGGGGEGDGGYVCEAVGADVG